MAIDSVTSLHPVYRHGLAGLGRLGKKVASWRWGECTPPCMGFEATLKGVDVCGVGFVWFKSLVANRHLKPKRKHLWRPWVSWAKTITSEVATSWLYTDRFVIIFIITNSPRGKAAVRCHDWGTACELHCTLASNNSIEYTTSFTFDHNCCVSQNYCLRSFL